MGVDGKGKGGLLVRAGGIVRPGGRVIDPPPGGNIGGNGGACLLELKGKHGTEVLQMSGSFCIRF